MIKSKLSEETIESKIYWFAKETKLNKQNSPKAFLLSIFDEYTIAYNDRSALSEERYIEKMISMGNALLAVIIFDGKVIGSWKREIKKNSVEIKLNFFEKTGKNQHEAIEKEAQAYGKFLGLSAKLV